MGGVFNVVNLHLYHYAGNNPLKYTDPDGREEVYILYGYTPEDKSMKQTERPTIEEEISLLKESGVTVKVIENATKADMIAAFSDPETMMIVTSGHGAKHNAWISTADGSGIESSDLKKVSSNLKTVIFENCHQGRNKQKTDWQKAFGDNVEIIGWERVTFTWETKSFNSRGIINSILGGPNGTLKSYSDSIIQQKRNNVLALRGTLG
jgi:hypothetical protein